MYTHPDMNANQNEETKPIKVSMVKRILRFIDLEMMIASIIMLVLWLGLSLLKPNQLYFPQNDSNSMFPAMTGSIPFSLLCGIVLGVFEVLFIILWFVQRCLPNHIKPFSLFTVGWALLFAVSLNNVVTNIFKSFVGRPRPDILDRCGADPRDGPCPNNITEKKLLDSYKSWPSGHSSTAFSGTFFLALFAIHIPTKKTVFSDLIASLFVIFGIYVGGTRIVEFRHHTDDVLAGFFVGFIFSFLTWTGLEDRIFHYNPFDAKEGVFLLATP